MKAQERSCLSCGKPVRGRVDRKFCSDYCRNQFNNARNTDRNSCVRSINHILNKNRRILQALLAGTDMPVEISRYRLLEQGFDFQFHTHTCYTGDGDLYFACYEYRYRLLDGRQCLLVQQEP